MVTSAIRAETRRAERRRRVERRRRRAVATITATLSACVMIVSGALLASSATGSGSEPQATGTGAAQTHELVVPDPTSSPTPEPTADASEKDDAEPFCSHEVTAAIDSGESEAVVTAAGGGAAFRDAVVSGDADACIALDHPAWNWVVVNKHRPIAPENFAPEVTSPATFSPIGAHLAPEAAAALDEMTLAAQNAGVGDIGLESGYRSYEAQIEAYDAQVLARGTRDGADETSARPGFSEHQLGLAADLVACEAGVCGSMYEFGDSPQGQWVAENASTHGWIVRYTGTETGTTGYEAEPWHMRFVGVELATAYVDGGYDTFEDFWGLEAAPDYE